MIMVTSEYSVPHRSTGLIVGQYIAVSSSVVMEPLDVITYKVDGAQAYGWMRCSW